MGFMSSAHSTQKNRTPVALQESLGIQEGLIRGYTVEGNRITILLKHYQAQQI